MKKSYLTWLCMIVLGFVLVLEVPAKPFDQTIFDRGLKEYLSMKDALVADNTWGASMAASRLKMMTYTWSHNHSVNSFGIGISEMMTDLDQISGTGDISIQRRYFAKVSLLLWQGVQRMGRPAEHVYLQHCPMAFEGEGGFWMSVHEPVMNPYFGRAMLRCGRTTAKVNGMSAADGWPEGYFPGALLSSTHVHGCHGPGQ